MDFYKHIWNGVLENIAANTTPTTLQTWIQPLQIGNIDEVVKLATLEIPDGQGVAIILNVVKDRYISLLEKAFEEVMGEKYKVVVQIKKVEGENVNLQNESETRDFVEAEKKPNAVKKLSKSLLSEKLLNPKYTFENFVKGASNQLAFSAAKAIVEYPGEAYNPFFIYGGSGLGKTHLMQAIGIEYLTNDPNMNVLYISSEMFTNDIVTALQENKIKAFKEKYSKVDALLIDDIQFFEGKEKTQDEFFIIFDLLKNLNKQIVISSDKSPDKLNNIDARLKTRFSWSLTADIQPPDFETRVSILKKKAEEQKIVMNDDIYEIIQFVAQNFKDNVRELEGAFNRVVAYAKLVNDDLNVKTAKKVLTDILSNIETQITPEKIKRAVCKKYGVKLQDLESDKKPRPIAYPRQIAMYLIREMTDKSFPEIAKLFGGKHHSTIKYACDKIEYEIKYNENLKIEINSIKEELKEI